MKIHVVHGRRQSLGRVWEEVLHLCELLLYVEQSERQPLFAAAVLSERTSPCFDVAASSLPGAAPMLTTIGYVRICMHALPSARGLPK